MCILAKMLVKDNGLQSTVLNNEALYAIFDNPSFSKSQTFVTLILPVKDHLASSLVQYQNMPPTLLKGLRGWAR